MERTTLPESEIQSTEHLSFCRLCLTTKPVTEFRPKRSISLPKTWCKECLTTWRRDEIRRRRSRGAVESFVLEVKRMVARWRRERRQRAAEYIDIWGSSEEGSDR